MNYAFHVFTVTMTRGRVQNKIRLRRLSMRKAFYAFICLIFVFSIPTMTVAKQYDGKKVLFVDSYHEGYAWSDGITKGVKKALDGTGVELKIIRMDTKRNTGDDFKKEAALKVKSVIEEFKPDVVIAADDNASKYLVVPYYKDTDLPVIFCGVNWDAGVYGFPTKNVTGMVEVAPLPQLAELLKKYSKGDRIGFLATDNITAKKEAENYKKLFGIEVVPYYAKSYDDWKKGFKELQGKVDMLVIDTHGGLYDDKSADLKAFVEANTKIPTGTFYDFMSDFALIGFAKVAEEQGFWASSTALKVLGGTSPADIPVAQNKEGTLIINTRIAASLGLDIPYEVIQSADKVIE
jgi:ABC-type uncharacterized transport system substrate-binding protein